MESEFVILFFIVGMYVYLNFVIGFWALVFGGIYLGIKKIIKKN